MDSCSHCLKSITENWVTLWDGKVYCRSCVESNSAGLFRYAIENPALTDTLLPESVRAGRFFRKLVLAGTIFLLVGLGIPLGLCVVTGKADPLLTGIFLGTFELLFIAGCAGASWVRAVRARANLPRRVSVCAGKVTVQMPPGREVSFALADCRWFAGKTTYDVVGDFLRRRRAILVETPEGRFACGLDDQKRPYWEAFLILAGIPTRLPPTFVQLAWAGVKGCAIGGTVGAVIGTVVTGITGVPAWTLGLALIAGLEGFFIALMYVLWRFDPRLAIQRISGPYVGIGFAAITFVIFVPFTGIAASVGLVSLNALVGAFVGWDVRRRALLDCPDIERDSNALAGEAQPGADRR